jgi:hypothetical protein
MNIYLKNVSEDQRKAIISLAKNWTGYDPKKNIKNTPQRAAVLFLDEKHQEMISEFKKYFIRYMICKESSIFDKKLLPFFEEMAKMSFEGMKYDDSITKADIEEMFSEAMLHCIKGIEAYDILTSTAPEYYFYAITSYCFQNEIRKRQLKNAKNVLCEDMDEFLTDEFLTDDFCDALIVALKRRLSKKVALTPKQLKENAVIESVLNIDKIESIDLNKKAVLDFMRTETGLTTKQIQRVFTRLKKIKHTWFQELESE